MVKIWMESRGRDYTPSYVIDYWVVRMKNGKKYKTLGRFDDVREACERVEEARRTYEPGRSQPD